MLVSVEAPHFCASIELQHDIVVRAAPILRWTIGQHRNDLRAMFARKGWHAKIIGSEPTKKGDIAPNRDDTPVDLDGMVRPARRRRTIYRPHAKAPERDDR